MIQATQQCDTRNIHGLLIPRILSFGQKRSCSVFTLNIQTNMLGQKSVDPYQTATVSVQKFRTFYTILFFFWLIFVFMHLFHKILGGTANNADPDQTAPSDLGLHSFYMLYIFFFLHEYVFRHLFPNRLNGMANSVHPDQTVPSGAVWSGSALFTYAILCQNVSVRSFGHLPYFEGIVRKGAVWSESGLLAI